MIRVRIIFTLFCLLYLAIVFRLFYWQVMVGSRIRAEAEAQYSVNFDLPATRGSIESSDGYPLVINEPTYLVYAEPKHLENIPKTATDISTILSLKSEDVLGDLTQPDRAWVPILHKVEMPKVQAIKDLKISGIGFEPEPKRYYPEASMAAHLLGFVASDQNGQDKGYFGLEGYYNRELHGKDGSLRAEHDTRGAPILVGNANRIEPQNGRSLVLWIDRTIQFIAQKRLKEGIAKYGAKQGSVVIMDPKTGGILAMASYPDYDPSSFGDYDKELYTNPVVGSSYEPGSTFKSLIMSAGLNENVVTPQTTFEEKGPVKVGQYFINTWNNEYSGTMTMTKVLEHSSNPGMVFVGGKLGRDKLLRYIRDFGFGETTNIDLEDESSPALREDRDWGEIDLATATFGQGIAVTPIQMVRAEGALANNGWLMEPHVVKEIRDNKKTVVVEPRKIRQVISEKSSHLITEMLTQAVDNGEAKWAKPKGYRIAGKTGTAQIPVAGHYDSTKTIASFIGYGPADNARFVMLVTLREPTSSPWGSETAAPLFFNIAQDIFHYYDIPPGQ